MQTELGLLKKVFCRDETKFCSPRTEFYALATGFSRDQPGFKICGHETRMGQIEALNVRTVADSSSAVLDFARFGSRPAGTRIDPAARDV